MSERGGFRSKFGLIAAIGGSVVGLGNIWRFPYLAGENGGAAFILIYLGICLFISVPVMISELSIGRRGGSDVVGSFRKLGGSRWWSSAGYVGVLASFFMLSFYCVIGGWSLHFVKESLLGKLAGLNSGEIEFALDRFVNSGWEPIVWTIIFVCASTFIALRGIEKGIERYNKIFMPMIVIILLGMFIYSTSMKGFGDAISFLFNPDFSKVTPRVVLDALGQSFFSLSLGMGTMITYGSYVNKQRNLGRLSVTISAADMLIAILSGLAIFPAVFSMGINPTSGPELVFVTLPSVFNQMGLGFILSIIFFFLLFFAAVTSSVSLVEVIVTYLKDNYRFSRLKAIITLSLILFISCSFSSLSQMEGTTLTIAGVTVFDFFSNASSNLLMPIGGTISVIFAGWVMSKKLLKEELTNSNTIKIQIYGALLFLIRFVAPLFIIILFLNLLGII